MSDQDVDIETGVIEEDVEITQRAAVGLLNAYVWAREQEAAAAKEKAEVGALIRRYLLAHPDEVLVDGERGIEARIQYRRSGSQQYDTIRMPAQLITRLKNLGALQVDAKIVRGQEGRSRLPEDIKPYALPGGETTALLVEKKG